MHRVQAHAVTLEATHAVELQPGIVLPPGHYSGTEWRTGLETMGGDASWAAPQYKIEFTPAQLASMGTTDTESDEIDVTKFVRSGELTVT